MMILWVDCDDTLVKWGPPESGKHPFGYGGDEATPNEPLIRAIKKFAFAHSDVPIAVWSGGGRKYAEKWGDKYLFNIYTFAAAKDFSREGAPHADHICIDDESLGVPATVYTAEEFIKRYG